MATGKEPFRIFISHKHDDHDAAHNIGLALRELDDQIRCFVSGTHLVAGTDWNAEIRSQLAESHLLLLVFTEPSSNWDWCLYEAGLFSSLSQEEQSVVCLYRSGVGSPRPLASLQGVPLEREKVVSFLKSLCVETWRVARKWRFGAIGQSIAPERLDKVADAIIRHFPQSRKQADVVPSLTHYPCHRVVLDVSGEADALAEIPAGAKVIEGEGATSTFTMSLFNFTRGLRSRTWAELVSATNNPEGQWLKDLNKRYAAAIREELFSPSLITEMPLIDAHSRQTRRRYRPMIYEIQRAPFVSGKDSLKPLRITLVLDPVADNPSLPPATSGSAAPA